MKESEEGKGGTQQKMLGLTRYVNLCTRDEGNSHDMSL